MASIISTKTSGGGGIAVTGDTSGVLELQSANGTTAVTIDASQNVGIGTSSPVSRLTVSGSNFLGSAISQVRTGVGEWHTIVNASGGLTIREGDITVANDYMTIASDGDVLIGTTSPVSTSNAGASFEVNANDRRILFLGTSSTSGNSLASFRNPNGQVGSISVSGSATTYNTSSDYRLKEDVSPMTGALDKVALLKPVTYKWKVDGSDGQGFIAHELQEVVPECVSGKKDGVDAEGNPEYQGVDTSFLVATLTAAIQELKARIEVLEGASA
jgi:hypothetical protein